MSRELNFRMYYYDRYTKKNEFAYFSAYDEFCDDTWCELNPKDLEQYTGLKDKNGKEIYEGDIVEEEFDDQTNSYEVIWDEIELTWSVKLIGYGSSLRSYLWELNASRLVIGNIHENKELLP